MEAGYSRAEDLCLCEGPEMFYMSWPLGFSPRPRVQLRELRVQLRVQLHAQRNHLLSLIDRRRSLVSSPKIIFCADVCWDTVEMKRKSAFLPRCFHFASAICEPRKNFATFLFVNLTFSIL